MSFAVIKTGGKQYKVKSGEILKIEKLPESKLNSKIDFSEILAYGDDKSIEVGAPNVEGAKVEADLKIQLNQKLKNLLENTDFSELCITSKAEVSYKDNIETTAITTKAKGSKCSICWKIKESVCDRVNCAVN